MGGEGVSVGGVSVSVCVKALKTINVSFISLQIRFFILDEAVSCTVV